MQQSSPQMQFGIEKRLTEEFLRSHNREGSNDWHVQHWYATEEERGAALALLTRKSEISEFRPCRR